MRLSTGTLIQISVTLRIGYLKTEFDGPATPPTNEQQRTQAEQRRAVYKTALEVLEKAGAKLTPIELPKFSTGCIAIHLVRRGGDSV